MYLLPYLFLYWVCSSFLVTLHESLGCINSRTYACGSHTSVLNFIFSTLSSTLQTIYLPLSLSLLLFISLCCGTLSFQELAEGNNASHNPFLYKGILEHGDHSILGCDSFHSGCSWSIAARPMLVTELWRSRACWVPSEVMLLPSWTNPVQFTKYLHVPGSLQNGPL